MPLLHCQSCQHEFEAINKEVLCDWCGGKAYVLQAVTSFEAWVQSRVKGLRKEKPKRIK